MMRRTLAALAALGLAASLAAPTYAQNILGMTMRPAPGSKDLAGTGLIDITRGETAGSYAVKVDLSKAAESLDLSKFEGAGAFVVWVPAAIYLAATGAWIKALLLTHQPIWTDPEVVAAEAREVFSGPVDVAKPGKVVDLP